MRELAALLDAGEHVVAGADAGGTARRLMPLALRAELPDWIAERLAARLTERKSCARRAGLNEPAPLDLRVNTLLTGRDEVRLRELAASGIASEPTPYSPVGIRVKGRPAINRHPSVPDGRDRGAGRRQPAARLPGRAATHMISWWTFAPVPAARACMLGALMRSRGRIYAFDVSAARLARLKPRLKRSGLSNLHPQRHRE